MMRVSTAGLYQTLLSGAMTTQSNYAQASIRQSSGLIGSSFSDYGADSQRLIDVEGEITNLQSWSSNAAIAGTRVQSAYSAIGTMIDTLTTLKTTISAAISGTSTTGLDETASQYLEELAQQLNTQSGGRYLFGGSDTDSAPVDLTSYPATSPPSASTADTSYYAGNGDVAQVTVGSGQRISYGVTADNSAFEKALRACAIVASSDDNDSTTLEGAFDLASEALTELSNLQATLSVTASRLSDRQGVLADTLTAAQSTLSDVKNIDVASAALAVTNYSNQLQASFSALSSVMKVRLTDYL